MLLTKPHKTIVLKRLAFIVVCFALGWYMKGKLTPSGAMMFGAGEPYVLVEELKLEDATTEKSHIAHVEAINSVSLQPMVSGTIEDIRFKEGSFVHEGDVLFTIEHETQLATLNLRKAELEKAVASGDAQNIEEEMGDLLFSCVNAARHLGVNAELALKASTEKFIKRFSITEELTKADGIDMKSLPIEELDIYWDKAKKKIMEDSKND